MAMGNKKMLSPEHSEKLRKILQTRFEKNIHRHTGLSWSKIQTKFEKNPGRLWSLNEMEDTGGEPDVMAYDKETDEYIFLIVRKKARKDAEVFATTPRHLRPGKNINRSTVP